MGGFIRFTSSEGAGTIFDVWLPGEQSPHLGDRGRLTVQPTPVAPLGSISSRQRIPDRSIQ